MIIFDSHTHIQFPVYKKDRNEVIARARKASVNLVRNSPSQGYSGASRRGSEGEISNGVKMICVGTQAETSAAAIELAKKYPEDIWATVGFHPNHVVSGVRSEALAKDWYHDKKEQAGKEPENFDIQKLRELAKDKTVVAIGECGFDYFRLGNSEQELGIRNKQREVFLEQANLAKELNKALMIHCRPSKSTDDAYNDLLQALGSGFDDIPRISHFYAGSLNMAKKLMEAGFYFTFGGVITFTRDYDGPIKYIPIEKILLETDAPYVTPAPHRGRRNEPAFILETAKKMAGIKGLEYDKIVEITARNAKKVFKIE